MAYTLVHTLGLEFRSAAGGEVVVLGINLFGAVVEVRTGAFWVVAMVTGEGVSAAAVAAVSVFAVAVAETLRAVWVMKVAATVVVLAAMVAGSVPAAERCASRRPSPSSSLSPCRLFVSWASSLLPPNPRIPLLQPSSFSLAGSFACL